MRVLSFCILFLLNTGYALSQVKPLPQKKPISADFKAAVPITINGSTAYGFTIAPDGPGKMQEIPKGNSLLFEEEHNTAWYLLTMGRNGDLTFEIEPSDTLNDYDFLLFAYTDSTFSDALAANKLKPLRSNISNLSQAKKGITGLRKKDGLINTIGEGKGNPFSNSILVKKGEKYVLVLDNVTPKGSGHHILFNFVQDIEIKGQIIDSDNSPVIADITLSDNRGNTVLETKSDKNGNYELKATVKENENYTITAVSDSTFLQTQTINTKTLKTATFTDLRMILPRLKKGSKYRIGNINFYGNMAILLPESLPSLEALYKLMKRNKQLQIQVEGHVNGPGASSSHQLDQTLSEERAESVYNYLVSKGIAKERMSFVGFANKFPLYKNPINEFQQKENRRVEIKVVSFE